MRFLSHEHADITAALRAHGIDPAVVLFVKRRGRLHVELPGRNDAFAFFREKSTKLDEHGRWQDRVDYFIGTRNIPVKSCDQKNACDWSTVLGSFNAWLANR